MLPDMSASEFTTIDRILKRHEDELIKEALAEIPTFILERQPRVMFENNGAALGRWLMFGRPPYVEWLELRSLGYSRTDRTLRRRGLHRSNLNRSISRLAGR